MARYGTAFIAGAVIGGVAGTAATLWRAPQPGRATRAQLGDQIRAHVGPAGPVFSAAADGLNAAGVRVAQAVTIATRFVEELVHPSATGLTRSTVVTRRVEISSPPAATVASGPAGPAGSDAAGSEPTGTPATVNPGSSFRPAAMNVTSISEGRRPR